MNENLINDFIDYIRFERRLSKNTIVSYQRDLEKYRFFLNRSKIKEILKVSNDQILYFLEFLYKTQNSSSVSRILSTLRTFYKYLVRDGKILKNPFSSIKNPKLPKKILEILDEQEVKKFLESIPTSSYLELRDKAMFELLYSCGMRVSEIVDLKLSDIDFDEGLIRFIGKGNKERITPVGDSAKDCLGKYIRAARYNLERERKSENVFLNRNGQKMTRQGFWKILKKYAGKVNTSKNLYPHLFRHSYATHMLERGADLRIVQELLGHSSISTTEIYTNINKKHVKETYFKYHPRDKGKSS
ncbi:MAG: site-specific tyrosine recombinase XerD [Actinobacteria bacterium]|nr:site-specific tyrosine recombinase XerD [Actinomycetota bacterium]MBU4450648.1 site-specific tyrosine recombinase XerD [Actinomycetota bacterium]MCG2788651.1 site-specific tyrosine recombinase XerD [Actinomycetes bacterium]